jgi:hypothetical protein
MSNSDQNNPDSFSTLLLHRLSEELYKAKYARGDQCRGTTINLNDRSNVRPVCEDARRNHLEYVAWTPELMQAQRALLRAVEPYGASSVNEQRRITGVLLQATREITRK